MRVIAGLQGWDDVEAAIARGEHAVALEGALASWRRLRDPRVGEIIDALGGLVPVSWLQHRADEEAFEDAFVELAREPGALATTALVSGLRRPVSADIARHPDNPLRWEAWHRRLDALARRESDPRVALVLARLVGDPPAWVTEEALPLVFDAHFESLLVAAADVRVIARFAQPAALAMKAAPRGGERGPAFEAKRVAIVRRLIVQVRERVPRLADGSTTRAHEILRERQRATDRALSSRLRAIAGDADPLAARAVFADELLERGDPWGELVAIASRGVEAEATVAALLAEHEERWLGREVSQLLAARVWKDAVLVEATLVGEDERDAVAPDHDDGRIHELRVLRSGSSTPAELVRFVTSYDLPALRTVVWQGGQRAVVALREQLPALEIVTDR